MPLGEDVKYRWKDGVRLAFKDNKVVEVKKKGGKSKLTAAGKRLMKKL